MVYIFELSELRITVFLISQLNNIIRVEVQYTIMNPNGEHLPTGFIKLKVFFKFKIVNSFGATLLLDYVGLGFV